MNWEKICDKTIEYSFYALFFLIPLIMTPWNFELFEYNKMMITYVLTIIITASWLIKMVLAKKFIFKHTFLDFPLAIFFASQLLSTIFSIDRHTSLWGYYSRFHGGLLSTISYLLLYYALVSNLDRKKVFNSLNTLLISALLVALYGLAEHFGIDAKYWVQDVQNRVFSTLGQPNWLAAWLIALMPLVWAFAINLKLLPAQAGKTKNLKLYLYYSLSALFYLILLYTKSRSALAALTPSYLLFWGLVFWLSKKEVKTPLKHFLITSSLFVLITFVAGSWLWRPYLESARQKFSFLPPVFAQVSAEKPEPTQIIPEVAQGGTESQTIRNIVWKGAIEIWKHYPLFGSGVETFAYSYYNYRPVEHNLVSEWDFLYNKAHNEYLNLLATTGLVGLGSYLLLIGAFIWLSIRMLTNKNTPNKSKYLVNGLLAGYVSILITNFFGFSVVPVAILFFLYPAMAIDIARIKEQESTRIKEKQTSPDYSQYAGIAVILLLTFYFLLRLAQFWYADVLYARGEKSLKSGYQQQAFQELQRAVSFNPNEPVFRSELGYSASLLAQIANQQKEEQIRDQLINTAISQSSQALSVSPKNLNFWKNRVKSFYSLAEIDPKFLQPALESLLEAIKLAPTDAKLWYNLGILYTKLEQPDKAIETLEKTVEMKENYQSARYALALLYEEFGQREKAIEQTKYILTYLNPSLTEVRELYKKLTGKEFGTE
jgi:putative inorganic carbon (HCO3(-)) transporter